MRRRSLLLATGTTALAAALGGRAAAAAGSPPLVDHTTPVDLDGTGYVDLSADAARVARLNTGTILVTFRTTSHRQAMTLLSASNPAEPSSNITLNLSAGCVQWSVRENGAVLIDVRTRTRYDDGALHTAAVTVDGTRTTLWVEGRAVFTTQQRYFFSAVGGLDALGIGRNVDSDHPGGEWFYTGRIERAAVWDRSLGEAELGAQSVRVDVPDMGRIATILNSDTPATWLFTGDSITHGALHTHGWRSYPEHWTERVRWELGKPKNRDFVIDTGVSGATSADLISEFDRRIRAFSPQVVSVMIGTNDIATAGLDPETYRQNLLRLVRSIRTLPGTPPVVLQSPNPVDPARWPGRVGLDRYAQVMGEVAEQERTVFVDHYRHWTAGGQVPLELLADGLHPDEQGHLHLVHKMIRDLRVFDADSKVCSLVIP
ncbi:GDSL-type esterase/lipase family protein [Streptomyces sp. NPDC003023]|uniref:GDSL-type esterase/lipase family protein n=1 Tax=Streptomyces sp. NPDC003023 TaxID=3364675 RepID=UPI0036CDDC82